MPDLFSLGRQVGAQLKARGQTVAIAESSTGGLISAALLAVPGASAYFRSGAVIYTVPARKLLTGIGNEAMRGVRSSSEPYALLLARDARERMETTWGVGETGAAGPTGNSHGDAPGHTCIAVAGPLEQVFTLETGQNDREANMWAFAEAALELLERLVSESP